MDSYKEVTRHLGFLITQSKNIYGGMVFHIRKPDGEIASTEFGTMDEPLEILQEIEEMLAVRNTWNIKEAQSERKDKKKEYIPRPII